LTFKVERSKGNFKDIVKYEEYYDVVPGVKKEGVNQWRFSSVVSSKGKASATLGDCVVASVARGEEQF